MSPDIDDLVSEHRALNGAVIEIGQRLARIDANIETIKETTTEGKRVSETLRRRLESVEKEQERAKVIIRVLIGAILLGGSGVGAILKLLP